MITEFFRNVFSGLPLDTPTIIPCKRYLVTVQNGVNIHAWLATQINVPYQAVHKDSETVFEVSVCWTLSSDAYAEVREI